MAPECSCAIRVSLANLVRKPRNNGDLFGLDELMRFKSSLLLNLGRISLRGRVL